MVACPGGGGVMIEDFQGDNRWLSNFFPCSVVLDDVIYPSTENAYQAAKTMSSIERKPFETITPAEAKKLGRRVKCGRDWGVAKLQIMEDLNRQKFSSEPFRSTLLATGDQWIEEGNTWGDTFWGVCNSWGENNLGKLIMRIRRELKEKSGD